MTSILALTMVVGIQNGGTQWSQLAKTKAIFWSNNKADDIEKYCFVLKCQIFVYLGVLVLHFSCPLRSMGRFFRACQVHFSK